ncbi:MAG: hypothetical protein ACYDBB_27180 [Armatimonadota bacterium]
MSYRALLLSFAILLATVASFAANARPAVLFYGWVHTTYVAKPLVQMGFEVDACPAGKLAERLQSGKYNVAVVNTLSDADRAAIDAFLARGGGVFVCNPENSWHVKDWGPTNEWLSKLGARPRWELLKDSDAANVVRDIMGCKLSYSTNVTAPVNEGVRGVLTLTWESTSGIEPPMSFDFGQEWTVVVRGATTHRGVPETRHDTALQPYLAKQPVAGEPPLMGIRQVGAGRMAVMGIRSHWLFTPPPNCPTSEAMLTAGAGGKPSDWLRVFANAFTWLADPSVKAGLGGAGTPDAILNPPATAWEIAKQVDWSKPSPLKDQPQTRGLIGARTALSSGTGTVAEYANAAQKAGLQYIVFLEDSLKMDQGKWDQLVQQCKAASSDTFLAVPGLTYEDAQGNHLYAFADQVKFPKPSMLLPDGRLATTQSYRTRAYFDYDNEYLEQKAIRGYWNHQNNELHYADYKLYNSFPIYSFENGKPIDNALNEFLFWQSNGGCQAALAFEFMTSPAMVAKRAAQGWKVVAHRDIKALNGAWHNGAWSFSGSGSQYITNGPSILAWDSPNRLTGSNGEWWRPDQWEYRLRLRVASEVGLKSVTILDGDREVFRRWQPAGAKQFEQELVLANSQQRGFMLVVEDTRGRKAISMSFWNRNLNMEEFYCSDRCNFLGNARLRMRDGSQYWTPTSFSANMGITPSKGKLDMSVAPAVSLTRNSPTLPVDGAPAGFPTAHIRFGPQIPGELDNLFAFSRTYLVGPEIGIGQADIVLGYDPTERDAKTTRLGHPYQQPQYDWGNAWSSWNRLIPTRKVTGWQRNYACNWLTEGFRIGWHETNLTVKDPITVGAKGLPVTSMKGELWQDGKKIASYETPQTTGLFKRGTFLTLDDKGGAVVLIGMDDQLTYEYNKGNLSLYYKPAKPELAKGDAFHYTVGFAGAGGGTSTEQMVAFAQKFGVMTPGIPGYNAEVTSGKVLDTYLIWRLDGQGKGIEASIPKNDLPGFLTACVEGLNDNWSVQLLDKGRTGANTRGLPIRDGRAFAQLDVNLADSKIFIGHPVIADNPQVKLLVSWQQPGAWFIEAHNPTQKRMRVRLTNNPGWSLFRFDKTITLPAGRSQVWTVTEEKQ